MRKAKAIYSEMCIARESGTITWVLTEPLRQREEWGSCTVEKNRGLQRWPDWRLLAWRRCWMVTWSWASYVIDDGIILVSLVGSNWKWGQNWGSCQSLAKSWPFGGQLLEILPINLTYSRLVSWASHCTQVISQNSVFIYGMQWFISLSVWWSCMSPKWNLKSRRTSPCLSCSI